MRRVVDAVTRGLRRSRPACFLRRFLFGSGLSAALVVGVLSPSTAQEPAGDDSLYLVTLDGPGTSGYRGTLSKPHYRSVLTQEQDAVLAGVDAAPPRYRWTTALNGFAVELSRGEADELRGDPRVSVVEENSVRELAGASSQSARLTANRSQHGGAGVVVGVVDTGIWPESPLFAAVPGLGREARTFRGGCPTGKDWDGDSCNAKLVGARWFVAGFGVDNLRTSSSLSPRDDSGHGTQMAAIAAGNAGVSVQVPGQRLGTYGGVAPQSRIAVYKACWTAPDPSDDGCATADLVTAIDQATRDGVDVLNLSAGGPPSIDTVERALLGAAEGDIVVVAAAGNDGRFGYAAHRSPWVTSVGGVTGDRRLGRISLRAGPLLTGAMASSRAVGPARVVVGARVPATGASRAAARQCRPGALDASRTEGAVVLCERGGIGRIAKSAAVSQADGVAMVLANVDRGTVESDLHSVPTLHIGREAGRAFKTWHADQPRARISLRPMGVRHTPARVTTWSSGGDPTATIVKPDVVAPAVGVLGPVPPTVRDTRWDFVSGTSAATAWTTGLAATLVARHDWSADAVRSALVTSATSVAGQPSVLREGAGKPRLGRADRPGLAYLVGPGAYRAWLDGSSSAVELNTPSAVLSGDQTSISRTVTNVGRRTMYFSSTASGFTAHQVTVTPAAVRLEAGESAAFEVMIAGPDEVAPLDDGWVTWLAANGSRVRIPVVLTR